jgi:hypothetical protein
MTFKVQRREADVGPDVGTSPTIIGVVSVRRLSAVRRGTAGQIVWPRILTIPMPAFIAAVPFYFLAADWPPVRRHAIPGYRTVRSAP